MLSILYQSIFGFFLFTSVQSHRIGEDPFHRREILDPDNRFILDWKADRVNNKITFNLTVEARGWVLFGFANNASETTGRDVVVGGVLKNGEPYLWDGNTGSNNYQLVRDISQDYQLEAGSEDGNHIFLSFSRNLDTCDQQDYPITENKVTLIWAFGNNKENDIKGINLSNIRNQGSYEVYLLDPDYAPPPNALLGKSSRVRGRNSASTKIWSISSQTHLSQNHTTYLCSIHKAPILPHKHHVIGFDLILPDKQSQRHLHHIIVTKCRAPQGRSVSALYERFARTGEQEPCYSWLRPVLERDIPTQFCSQIYGTWALGGRIFFTPDDVGFPFGEEPEEYYLLQAHYDNADMLPGVTVNLRMDFFYTSTLRPFDGGMVMLGRDIPGLPTSTLVPPRSTNFQHYGHCSPECTNIMFPREGITAVAGHLHTHYSGRQARLRHFRGNEELPWVLYDDNYNPRYQQIKALPQGPVKILPGDQLTTECIYDNTWTNTTVLGGFDTKNEMCVVFLVHYTYIPDFAFCRSDIISPPSLPRFLGIGNATWFQSELDWVAMSPRTPPTFLGRTVTDISDNFIEWDAEARQRLREFQEGHQHTGACGRDLYTRDPAYIQQVENTLYNQQRAAGTDQLVVTVSVPTNVHTEDDFVGPVDYVRNAVPYQPPQSQCDGNKGNYKFGWGQ